MDKSSFLAKKRGTNSKEEGTNAELENAKKIVFRDAEGN